MKDLSIDIHYFRPPWGNLNLLSFYYTKENNLQMVFWTAMVGDWSKNITDDLIIHRLTGKLNNSNVICLHDGRGLQVKPDIRHTLDAVDRLVPEIQARGFKLETVSQLLCPTN
jgi:peptidoglycan/xylan/chitin deacetylase (PgdA/CDA1 family)